MDATYAASVVRLVGDLEQALARALASADLASAPGLQNAFDRLRSPESTVVAGRPGAALTQVAAHLAVDVRRSVVALPIAGASLTKTDHRPDSVVVVARGRVHSDEVRLLEHLTGDHGLDPLRVGLVVVRPHGVVGTVSDSTERCLLRTGYARRCGHLEVLPEQSDGLIADACALRARLGVSVRLDRCVQALETADAMSLVRREPWAVRLAGDVEEIRLSPYADVLDEAHGIRDVLTGQVTMPADLHAETLAWHFREPTQYVLTPEAHLTHSQRWRGLAFGLAPREARVARGMATAHLRLSRTGRD